MNQIAACRDKRVMIRRRTPMIWFHWLTALLVTLSFAIAWIRKDIEDLEFRAFWLDVHRTVGFAILALTLVRLVSRFRLGPLSRRADMPRAMWLASRVTHFSIYALLIAMPLLGWAQSSARARHFNLFGAPIPAIVGHDRDMAEVWGWWHEQVGWALLALILLHAMAALFHHYVRRDELVRAMLPGYKPPIGKPAAIQSYDIAA
jgi:cytochrome b561